jgi:hypothetical protein
VAKKCGRYEIWAFAKHSGKQREWQATYRTLRQAEAALKKYAKGAYHDTAVEIVDTGRKCSGRK